MFKQLRDLGVEYKPVNYNQVETIDEIVKKLQVGIKLLGLGLQLDLSAWAD